MLVTQQKDGVYFTEQNWDLLNEEDPNPAKQDTISNLRYLDDVLHEENSEYL